MIKKNITINFCGRLYAIDEDAYELLQHYTDTIRRYYSKIEGGEEVADDIEARIAELFDEYAATAIDIQLAEKVIRQIGKLEDITAGDVSSDATSEPASDTFSTESTTERLRRGANAFAQNVEDAAQNTWQTLRSDKRFFRDSRNALLGGVLAGCAQYFGGSMLLWRLLFLVLVIVPIPLLDWMGIGAFALVVYLVLWIIAPMAETPEQVLQMHGEQVNPQNLAEEVTRQSAAPKKSSGNILFGLLKIAGCLLFLPFILASLFLFIGFITATSVFLTAPLTWFTTWFHFQPEVFTVVQVPFYIACVALGIGLFILVYCCIHAALSSMGKVSPMGTNQRLTWLVAFIGSIIILIVSCVKTYTDAKPIQDKWRDRVEAEDREQHMHDGFYFSNQDWNYFQCEAWRLIIAENCGDNEYTRNGEYVDIEDVNDDDYGKCDYDKRYLNAWASDHNLRYQAERTEGVEAGTYKLTCSARCAEGSDGVYIYAIVDGTPDAKPMFAAVPALGNSSRNNGWSTVTISNIKVPEGSTIRYGVSTDPDFTHQTSHVEWFSACDFKLTQVND